MLKKVGGTLTMNNAIQGTVHGKSIELSTDPGLEDGQRVEVVLLPVSSKEQSACSAAGMLAEIPGLDESLKEIQQQRQLAPHRTDSL